MKKVFFIILISCFSLTIISCSDEKEEFTATATTTTDNTTTTDTTAPTVSSISPTDNKSWVELSDNISVTFSESMDTTSITTNTSNTSCSGSLQLSSDNFSGCVQMSSSPSSSNSDKTFAVDPAGNLSNSTTYKIRVTTGVKDSAGNAMSSQYETSNGFKITSIYNKTNGDNHGSTGKMDYNGYTYNVVRIDDRWWTAENLRTTTYNDGTSISKWGSGSGPSTEAYCDSDNSTKYGYLYNQYAAFSGKLAPTGWHAASDSDWSALQQDVDSSGLKLLATEEGGTNDVGFSALLGGARLPGGSYTWNGGAGSFGGFLKEDGNLFMV